MSTNNNEEYQQKNFSRRDFLKKTGVLAGGVVGASVLLSGCSDAETTTGTEDEKWDYETDVVVIGLGGAGACAAIEAHDAGAKVMILEKQAEDHHINNTRMSGGIFHNPHTDGDRAARIEYIKAMMSGENIPGKLEGEQPHVSTEMAEMFADLIMENEEFLLAQAPDLDPTSMKPSGDASFPMFPKFKEAKYGGSVQVRYNKFANADSTLPLYKRKRETKSAGEAFFWALVEDGVKKNRPDVEILYETPATSLIKKNGEIIGATALTVDGKDIKIKAKKAVVLTSGGFEYSLPMRRAFLEGPGVNGWTFYGSPDNTGDGIEMAISIGASLAKVAKSASRIEPALPHGENYEKYGLKMGTMSAVSTSKNSCVVDNFGERYANEHFITDITKPYRYQFYKEAVKYDMLTMDYPRTPSWAIFDETRRTAGPVVRMDISTIGFGFLPWTEDNMDAINKGWIIKADTIEELAEKIYADDENKERIEKEKLVNTIKKFNEYCATGNDLDFERDSSTMGPIEKPPFYAMKHYPGGPNTKGGIDCNAKREVLDWDGNPIPRLFSAGEISSVFKFTYQGGGNLTECIICGRVAGKNAAAMTSLS